MHVTLQRHTGWNGTVTTYQQTDSGTCYHEETDQVVIRILEDAIRSRKRIRIFYGDRQTGRSWNDEYDVIGRISRSTGHVKIPLLVKTERSLGGSGILDHCIIRIQEGVTVLYRHPDFHIGAIAIRRGGNSGIPWELWIDGDLHARFGNIYKAQRFVEFLNGRRNSKGGA